MGQVGIGLTPTETRRFDVDRPKDWQPSIRSQDEVDDLWWDQMFNKGQRAVNTTLDFFTGSTPEEEAQMALDPGSYVNPMSAVIKPVVRRGVSSAAGPVNRRLLNPAPEITTYHGARTQFPPTPDNPLGAFDPKFIGSGEGSQYYGQGFYNSAVEDVGDHYYNSYGRDWARALQKSGFKTNPGLTTQDWRAQNWLPEAKQSALTQHTGQLDKISKEEVNRASEAWGERYLRSTGQSVVTGDMESRVRRSPLTDHVARVQRFINQRSFDVDRGNPGFADKVRSAYDAEKLQHGAYTVFPDRELLDAMLKPYEGIMSGVAKPGPALYEVGLRVSPEELLDLGLPLERQSLQAQQAVRNIFDPLQSKPPPYDQNQAFRSRPGYEPISDAGSLRIQRGITPEEKRWLHQSELDHKTRMKDWEDAQYRDIKLFMDPARALNTERTGLLREQGIPGAQYQGRTSGAQDYVIWDPSRAHLRRRIK